MKQNQFRALQKIYTGLLMGQLGFGIVALVMVLIVHIKTNESTELDRPMQLIAVLFAIGGAFIGFRLYKKKVLEIGYSNKTAGEKMNAFRAASIVFWALLEGPALFSVICYLLTGNLAFMALFAVLIFIFGTLNPFKGKVVILLKLSSAETAELDGSV